MEKTLEQYQSVIAECRVLFEKKLKDYGTAWRILRLPSVTDQIYIKAARIRTLQETTERKVDEDESSEFIGIINYSIIALIQLENGVVDTPDFSQERAIQEFDKQFEVAFQLMQNKNHDYGEIWRDMRISSITDLILTKILRLKSMENNNGLLLASEGREANYLDMINYAVFALILLKK